MGKLEEKIKKGDTKRKVLLPKMFKNGDKIC